MSLAGYIVSNCLGHPVLLINGKRRRTSAHIKSLLVESPDTEGSVCRKMQEEPGVGGTREELVVHYKHACIFSSMKPVYTVVNIFGLNALWRLTWILGVGVYESPVEVSLPGVRLYFKILDMWYNVIYQNVLACHTSNILWFPRSKGLRLWRKVVAESAITMLYCCIFANTFSKSYATWCIVSSTWSSR